jgi:histidyl-tRNA synthetase
MHLRCCSIAARAEIKVVELRIAHLRVLESLKKFKNEQVMHILMSMGLKTQQENSLITQQRMNIIMLMHEQMPNDP